MATVQPAREPLEVAMDFIKRINAGNVDAICALMTDGHIFQDALGARFIGKEKMRQGARAYVKAVPQYKIQADDFFEPYTRWWFSGCGSENYAATAPASPENFWEVP